MNFSSFYRAGIIFVIILGLFLSACGSTSASAQSNSHPCANTTPGVNVYRTPMTLQVKDIYSQWVRNQGNPDPSTAQAIKNQAFTLLVEQVKRWTSAVDIANDDINVIRVTLTYVSPELIQVMLLNRQLYKNSIAEIDFEKMLITEMYEIANQEKFVFLMTITYSQYNYEVATESNRVMISIPMERLVLTNSENRQTIAQSVDPHLRQEITISQNPSAGYIAFPIGMETSEDCLQVLDRLQNTEINVSVRGMRINGIDYAPQLIWFVKYHPLIEMDDGFTQSVDYQAPTEIPIHHQPPVPVRNTRADLVDHAYWEIMALHVWGYLTDP